MALLALWAFHFSSGRVQRDDTQKGRGKCQSSSGVCNMVNEATGANATRPQWISCSITAPQHTAVAYTTMDKRCCTGVTGFFITLDWIQYLEMTIHEQLMVFVLALISGLIDSSQDHEGNDSRIRTHALHDQR